jgi:hypothetical protein
VSGERIALGGSHWADRTGRIADPVRLDRGAVRLNRASWGMDRHVALNNTLGVDYIPYIHI